MGGRYFQDRPFSNIRDNIEQVVGGIFKPLLIIATVIIDDVHVRYEAAIKAADEVIFDTLFSHSMHPLLLGVAPPVYACDCNRVDGGSIEVATVPLDEAGIAPALLLMIRMVRGYGPLSCSPIGSV
ncbi:hypothetical protein DL764_005838 [Monosporascus ibericus]|uniref:Uncharacterized protein n=1 Tax=Monosporascus ibericus TaxID=155417 RepID=A0A4Q4T796_9PEZI|nr:hypothetical protein DL764_005838 [Monosporascus ibericus]